VHNPCGPKRWGSGRGRLALLKQSVISIILLERSIISVSVSVIIGLSIVVYGIAIISVSTSVVIGYIDCIFWDER